jgi:hypothetical protein
MARSSDPGKVRQWQQRMARFQNSNRSVARFCQGEGVSVASFYQWREKLQQLAPSRERSPKAVCGFRPVRLVAGSASLAVRLPGGTQLEVPTTDPQVVQLALQTLAQVDAQRVAGGETC